jgi:hypothetical protein
MDLLNMPVIQIALCIVISWALFAIFVGIVQEAIAQVMSERGRFMKKYFLRQLDDQANGINWGTLLYLHGSIDLLTRETNKPTNDINPKLFAQVLVDVVGNALIVQVKKKPGTFYNNPALSNFKSAMQTLNSSDVIEFLRLALNNAESKQPIYGQTVDEGVIYQQLVTEIENWNKEFQERLSLWYKKRIRKKLFVLGFIISLVVNVDSIQLFNFYQVNPQSRAAVEKYYTNYIADSSKYHPNIDNKASVTVQGLDSLVKVTKLPVGFDYSVFNTQPKEKGWFVWKILGLLITGFAASFGAPFWFDVLKKAYSKKV